MLGQVGEGDSVIRPMSELLGPKEEAEDVFEGKRDPYEANCSQRGAPCDKECLPLVHGDSEFHHNLRKLCTAFDDVFAKTVREEPANVTPLRFQVDVEKWEASSSNTASPRRLTPEMQEVVKATVNQLLELGVIVRSNVERASQVLLVPKPGGKWRLCIDYRELNAAMVGFGWPLPHIKSMIQRIGKKKGKYFGVIDLTSGYHQLLLEQECRKLAAFRTAEGMFEPVRIPFGIKVAPAFFQKAMAEVFEGLIGECMEIYIDDMFIYGETQEEFLTNLGKVFQRARERGLTINPDKCKLGVEEVEFVGHVINAEGTTMSDEKRFKVVDFEKPKTVKKMQSFLGLINYFHDYIRNCDQLTKPLRDIMLDVLVKKRLVWNPQADEAFERVKEAIQNCPQLYFLQGNQDIVLETDASDYGIGAVLYQRVGKKKHIVGFMSKALNSTQRNWTTIEKEAYAIFYALEHFETHLFGNHFLLRTDHANLRYLNNKTPKVVRWKCAIQEFDFDVEHVAGKENECADAFSRLIDESQDEEIEIFEDDSQTRSMIMMLEEVVIPEDKVEIIKQFHGLGHGHFGVDRTIWLMKNTRTEEFAKKGVFDDWPNLRAHVKKYIRCCDVCQKSEGWKKAIVTSRYTTSAHRPMERVSMDTIGPFGKTEKDYRYVVVIIDCFSRFVDLYPVKSTTGEEAAEALLWHLGRYGAPLQIVSDNGPQFVNASIQELFRLTGVHYSNTMAYSHQENGIVERANREVLRHVRNIMYERNVMEKWHQNLPMVMRLMNSTVHESLGFAPASIIYGNSLDMNRELIIEHVVPKKYKGKGATKRFQDWVDSMLAGQTAVVAAAQKHLQARDEKHLAQEDKNKKLTQFKVGSYVLVFSEANSSDKLKMNWQGPYRVVKKATIRTERGWKERDDAYVLQCVGLGNIRTVTIHHMKAFNYRTDLDLQIAFQRDSNEWLVDHIVSHTGSPQNKSRMEFEVKWVGLDQSYNRLIAWRYLRSNVKLHEYLRKKGGKFEEILPAEALPAN
jgi:mRNA-degrading endonuclease RelE of RelBE toxin-antitoxin system